MRLARSRRDLVTSAKADSNRSSKVVLLRSSAMTDDSSDANANATIYTLPEIFRSTPIPSAPMSFSSVVSSVPQTPHRLPPPSEADDLEVEVYEWEELPKQNIDEWTEAKKKGSRKKPSTAGAESAKKPAGSTPGSKNNTPGKDKKSGKQRGGNNHKSRGVRDIKPRPCHSHYLSTSRFIIPVFLWHIS